MDSQLPSLLFPGSRNRQQVLVARWTIQLPPCVQDLCLHLLRVLTKFFEATRNLEACGSLFNSTQYTLVTGHVVRSVKPFADRAMLLLCLWLSELLVYSVSVLCQVFVAESFAAELAPHVRMLSGGHCDENRWNREVTARWLRSMTESRSQRYVGQRKRWRWQGSVDDLRTRWVSGCA